MKTHLIWYCLLLLGFGACGVLLEDDLSKEKVIVISPSNNFATSNQSIEFRWDSMNYAQNYRFQLVIDSFGGNGNWVLDTIIDTTRLRLSLIPNTYMWRVTGKNINSESDYNTYKLVIQPDSSLKNQTITTIYPIANAVYTADSVSVWWYLINTNAVVYQVQIANHISFNSQSIVQDIFTGNDNYSFINVLGFGTFYWKMRAMRPNIDTTVFTPILSFSIDVIPTLNQPANNSIIVLPYAINWNSTTSILRDSLFIYYESEAMPYKIVATNNRSYTFNSADTIGKGIGNYYWNVRSLGQNNNSGSYSELRKFSIN